MTWVRHAIFVHLNDDAEFEEMQRKYQRSPTCESTVGDVCLPRSTVKSKKETRACWVRASCFMSSQVWCARLRLSYGFIRAPVASSGTSLSSSAGLSLCCTASGTSTGSSVRSGEASRQGQWHDWLELESASFSCGSWAQLLVSARVVTAPLWWPWSGRQRNEWEEKYPGVGGPSDNPLRPGGSGVLRAPW